MDQKDIFNFGFIFGSLKKIHDSYYNIIDKDSFFEIIIHTGIKSCPSLSIEDQQYIVKHYLDSDLEEKIINSIDDLIQEKKITESCSRLIKKEFGETK